MGRVADFFREQGLPLGQQQKAQMLALDREFVFLEEKVTAFQAENLKLRAEVNPLKERVKRLEQQLEQKPASATVHALDPNEIAMMKFIGNRKGATAETICTGMNLHSVHVEHFLGRLLKENYLDQSHVPVLGAWYALSDKGNAYLVENKLVPLSGGHAEQPSNPKGHHCDHCGSTKLRRTGSRPDPTFHAVGVKQALYKCLDCQQDSAFTNDEAQA